ncbi:MAG: EpsI family protein [Gemmatimonadaceae bacterium]|nr:EpsI family protein [Gemmatimonadaceae bacterium]
MKLLGMIPAVVLGSGALLISGMRPQKSMQPQRTLGSVARVLDRVEGKDIPIAAEERKVAGMSHYLLREYSVPQLGAVTLYIGYYDRQVQGKAIHSPKNCLPGAGWEIISSERVPLKSVTPAIVNEVLLANKGTRALVLYWYQGRGRVESSEYRVKWDLLRDAALFGRTEEALVRLVIPLNAESRTDDEKAMGFAKQRGRQLAAVAVAVADSVMPRGPRDEANQ